MKQGAFAALCGISQPMVSKYAAAGHLVLQPDGSIDAQASLEALEGRLDEAKRTKALATLGGSHTPLRAAAGLSGGGQGAKAQKDAIERDLKALQLGREAGELVTSEEVDAAGRQAVTALREAFANGRRDMAAAICTTFGIPADRQPALARFIGQHFESALGAFARELRQALDGDAAQPSEDAPAVN